MKITYRIYSDKNILNEKVLHAAVVMCELTEFCISKTLRKLVKLNVHIDI